MIFLTRYSLLSVRIAYLALITLMLSLFSCRTKDKENTVIVPAANKSYGAVTIKVSNEVNGQPVIFGSYNNTNAAGNLYTIDQLKYYISNFTLIKADSTETNFHNYKLLDASDINTCKFTFDSVSNGTYKAIRFYLGIDSLHNHSGLQEGALDPINGMIWTWNTGYIFFKHRGNFIDDTGGTSILLYDYGSDNGMATIDIPITQFEVKGTDHTIFLKFDLNTLYNSPDIINFNHNNIHQGTDIMEAFWVLSLKPNFSNAFRFDKVQ